MASPGKQTSIVPIDWPQKDADRLRGVPNRRGRGFVLPEVRCKHRGRAGTAMDDDSGDHDLNVLLVPRAGSEFVQLLEVLLAGDEFGGGKRTPACDSGGDDGDLLGARIA